MRILHVSDCYAPRTGGIETQVRALALAQAEQGAQVEVVTATPGEGDDSRIPIHRITMKLPADLPIHLRTRKNVSRLLAHRTPSVVHVHAGAISPFAWGGIRAAVEAGIPTVVTVHSVWGNLARPAARIAHTLVQWAKRGVVFTSVSTMAAERVRSALDVSQVLVTPNGIDASRWHPRPPVEHRGIEFIAVQRLAPRKRSVELVEAFARVVPHLPDAHLTIVGDGPQRSRVERSVRDLGLHKHVTLAGRLGFNELTQSLAGADVFIQPSRLESFGIAALEARTMGLPVIAYTNTGTADFIHTGIEGVLVKTDACLERACVALGTDTELRTMITGHNRHTPPVETWSYVLESVDVAYRLAGAL